MMNSVFFDHATIDRWISEDAPLLDLTSHMLEVGQQSATIEFVIRHDGIAACTEEVQAAIPIVELLPNHLLPLAQPSQQAMFCFAQKAPHMRYYGHGK